MKLWFKRKTWGWGWRPVSWQAWLSLIIWAVALFVIFVKSDINSHSLSDALYASVIPALLLTLAMWLICWLTGERPRWQWGKAATTHKNRRNYLFPPS